MEHRIDYIPDSYLDAPYQRQFDGEDGTQHVLLTPADCPCDKAIDIPCPICDGGLAFCVRCGKAEVELDEPCDDANNPDESADDPGLTEDWEEDDDDG